MVIRISKSRSIYSNMQIYFLFDTQSVAFKLAPVDGVYIKLLQILIII